MSPSWFLLGAFNVAVADFGMNHGGWTLSAVYAVRNFLSSVGFG
jgi:hypothetical protein